MKPANKITNKITGWLLTAACAALALASFETTNRSELAATDLASDGVSGLQATVAPPKNEPLAGRMTMSGSSSSITFPAGPAVPFDAQNGVVTPLQPGAKAPIITGVTATAGTTMSAGTTSTFDADGRRLGVVTLSTGGPPTVPGAGGWYYSSPTIPITVGLTAR